MSVVYYCVCLQSSEMLCTGGDGPSLWVSVVSALHNTPVCTVAFVEQNTVVHVCFGEIGHNYKKFLHMT